MQITLRIYRTHDYDLMALHRSGVLSFPKAARKALISYYKGETILISTEIDEKQVPEDLPAMLEFNITIGERTAPGFAEWFRTVKSGYRNNLLKIFSDQAWTDSALNYINREQGGLMQEVGTG